MSHEEQYAQNVTEDEKRVKCLTINKGSFILFHRNLLHQGVSYEQEHLRVFAYVEIYPKGFDTKKLTWANPGETSKYVSPRDNSVAPLKQLVEEKKNG